MAGPPEKTLLEQGMLPKEVTGLQVLVASFMLGLLSFALVVFYHFLDSSSPDPGLDKFPGPDAGLELLSILSIAHAAVFICSWATGLFLYRFLISRPLPISESSNLSGKIRGAFVVRLACIESPALFGCVVCFLMVKDYTLDDPALFWLNFLSPAAALVFMASTFPTRKNIQKLLAGIPPGPDELPQ